MFSWLANRSADAPANKMADKLYAAIVAQARQPAFYSELGVADTIPGRFELISLHMFIILDRLARADGSVDEVSQKLVDVMFQDMDDVARETGVGDMGVGPRIKKLARSFRSRLEYYKEAIEGDGRSTLPEAIIEIYFEGDDTHSQAAQKLADYVTRGQARVADMTREELADAPRLFARLRV